MFYATAKVRMGFCEINAYHVRNQSKLLSADAGLNYHARQLLQKDFSIDNHQYRQRSQGGCNTAGLYGCSRVQSPVAAQQQCGGGC